MWRITKDPIYGDWGWEIFKAFREHLEYNPGEGIMSIHNVNEVPPPQRDNMESFWLVSGSIEKTWWRYANSTRQSETLKYLYLLFSPDEVLPLTDVVFNTEAHVFPRMGMGKFKTGWERKPKGED
jgi:hypothetical protein